MEQQQDEFDLTIGRLDHVLSKLVIWGKTEHLPEANKQTLKHHAEDMIAAGEKILKDLAKKIELRACDFCHGSGGAGDLGSGFCERCSGSGCIYSTESNQPKS